MAAKHTMVHEKQGPFRHKVESSHKPKRKHIGKRGGKK